MERALAWRSEQPAIRKLPDARLRLAIAALVLAAVAMDMPGAQAALYKWTDDKGVVHYTDKIPPDVVNKGNVELNKQGIPIRKTEPALTPEQRRAREIEAEQKRLLAREQEIVDRRDRALLSTYTSENEIDLARNRSLNTIEAQMQSSMSYRATLNKRKDEIDKRRIALGDRPLSPVEERELASVTAELAKQGALIEAKQKEIAVVNARYDADKERWRELRLLASKSAGEVPQGTPAAAPATVPVPGPVPASARK